MAITIKPKRTTTAGKVPTTADLADGELGINLVDKKAYVRNGSTIHQISIVATTLSGYGITDAVAAGSAFTDAFSASPTYYNGTTTSVDCNGLGEGTRVLVNGSGTNSNYPSTGSWYIETVRGFTAGLLVQKAWAYNQAGRVATRSYNGTSWTAWVVIGAAAVGANLTFVNDGSGAASGAAYNGGSAITVSHNTVGALSINGGSVSGTIDATGLSVGGSAVYTLASTIVDNNIATSFRAGRLSNQNIVLWGSATGNSITSLSSTTASKVLILDSTTDSVNTASTGGAVGIKFRIMGVDAGEFSSTGQFTLQNNLYLNGSSIVGDAKEMLRFSDSWLRLNPNTDFTSGVFSPGGVFRHDGTFQTGSTTTAGIYATLAGTFNYQGNAVYHAGNLTPADYAPLAGALFTGSTGVERASVADTTRDLFVENGTQYISLYGKLTAGSYNPGITANDAAILFSAGTSTNGAMHIGPWDSVSRGIKLYGSATNAGTAMAVFSGAQGSQTGHIALHQGATRLWQMGIETARELKFWSYTDAGAFQQTAFTLTRDGLLTLAGGLTANSDITAAGTANLLFGSGATRQMINLWSTTYGIGIQNNTMYFRTGSPVGRSVGGFAWHRAGVHDVNVYNPGTGGTKLAHLDGDGNFNPTGELVTTAANGIRMIQGNYGVIFRQDGATLYILLTASADQNGSWNSLRPFSINVSTGDVSMTHDVTIGGNLGVTGTVSGSHHYVSSGNGVGLRFWGDTAGAYTIYMSGATDATWGGRPTGDTTSDYNMYFKMTAGTNRGFVFKNGATVLGGIDGGGKFRVIGSIYTPSTIEGSRIFAGYDAATANSISCSAWFRSNGQTGWYNSDYGGGVYMTDTTYVRAYNGKAMYATDFVASSDERLKTAIVPLRYKGRLRPVNFVWKRDAKPDFGFIAQEVQLLYPEAVDSIKNEDPFGPEQIFNLSYPKLTAVLSHQVNAVEDRVITLEKKAARVDKLERELKTLKRQMAKLLKAA